MIVVLSIVKRWVLIQQYAFLGLCRSFRLWQNLDGLFYGIWLYSSLGWSRLSRYKSEQNMLVRGLFFLICVVVGFNYDFLGKVSYYIYSFFSMPVMSDTGYIGYTVFVASFFVYIIQGVLLISSQNYRNILGPYYNRLVTLNVLCLIILLSIFSQISRIKFGIRVWFPYERIYDEHSTLNYWDW